MQMTTLFTFLLYCLPPILLLLVAWPTWHFSQRVNDYGTRVGLRLAALCFTLVPMILVDPQGTSYTGPAVVLLVFALLSPFYIVLFAFQLLAPWSILYALIMGRYWWQRRRHTIPADRRARLLATVLASGLAIGGIVWLSGVWLGQFLSSDGVLDPILIAVSLYVAAPFAIGAGGIALQRQTRRWATPVDGALACWRACPRRRAFYRVNGGGTMRKFTYFAAIGLALLTAACAQPTGPGTAPATPGVSVATLVASADSYDGRVVCLEGIAASGVEVSALGSAIESDRGALVLAEPVIWLERITPVSENTEACEYEAVPPITFCPVRVCGRFETGGGFGHLGGYDFQLVGPAPPRPYVRAQNSLTTFTHFTYAQEGGDGFCPQPGVLRAEISRRPGDELLFTATIISPEDIEACNFDCEGVGTVLPARALTAGEVEQVLATFAALEIQHQAPRVCEGLIADYCLRPVYRWDSTVLTGDSCSPPYLTREGTDALQSLLKSLAAASPLPDAATAPAPASCTTYEDFTAVIWDVEMDADGRVWVAGNANVAYLEAATGTWRVFNGADAPPGNGARTITVAADGRVWRTTWGRVGVSYFDGQRWTTLTSADGLPSDEVNEVAVDDAGVVWFATQAGVARWNPAGDQWRNLGDLNDQLALPYSRIQFAADGAVWFGNRNRAVAVRYDEAAAEVVVDVHRPGDAGALGVLRFDTLTLAPDGVVWAVVGGRPAYLDPSTATWRELESCLIEVRTLAFDGDGQLWVGTNYGGAFFCPLTDGTESPRYVDSQSGLLSNEVIALHTAPDGALWLGTAGGLSRCELPVE